MTGLPTNWKALATYFYTWMLRPQDMAALGEAFYREERRLPTLPTCLKNAAFFGASHKAWREDCDRLHAAVAGDIGALKLETVHRFNRLYDIGTPMVYRKSEQEGVCTLGTVSKAYQLDDGTPVVNLEGIGVALLTKIEHDAVVLSNGGLLGPYPVMRYDV